MGIPHKKDRLGRERGGSTRKTSQVVVVSLEEGRFEQVGVVLRFHVPRKE